MRGWRALDAREGRNLEVGRTSQLVVSLADGSIMTARRTGITRLAEYGEELEHQADKARRARTMLMVAAPFFAILMFMAVTKDSNDQTGDAGAYDAAVLWAEEQPVAYRLTYTITGQAGELGPATVTVENGLISAYETDDPALEDSWVYTVSRALFTIEDVANDPEGDVLSATYHPDLGYPLTASFDPIRGAVDDEWSFEVTEFEVLS